MFSQSVLKNGLQVVTNEMRGRNSIGLAVWLRVGGRHETSRLSGISHFVEHMLFKGTKSRSTKQIKEAIEGVGGTMNAFTGEESTCYFVKIPKPQFELAFDVLQDMINHSILPPAEIEKERTVILEEIKMYLDHPSQHVHELIGELLWPNHPLGHPLTGSDHSVRRIHREDLLSHVQNYYHPKNTLVTACGDLSHSRALSLAERFFGSGPQKSGSRFKAAEKPRPGRSKRFCFLDKKTEQTHFVLAFHGLPRSHRKRYQLMLLNIILGGNMSSRLFEEVREKRGLAYEIRSALNFLEDTGAVSVAAGVEPKKTSLALQVIMRELSRLAQKRVSAEELRRAKDYFRGQLLLGLEDTLDNILWFGERVLYGGGVPNLAEIQEEIEKVTPKELETLAGGLFRNESVHLALIGPLGKGDRENIEKKAVLK